MLSACAPASLRLPGHLPAQTSLHMCILGWIQYPLASQSKRSSPVPGKEPFCQAKSLSWLRGPGAARCKPETGHFLQSLGRDGFLDGPWCHGHIVSACVCAQTVAAAWILAASHAPCSMGPRPWCPHAPHCRTFHPLPDWGAARVWILWASELSTSLGDSFHAPFGSQVIASCLG